MYDAVKGLKEAIAERERQYDAQRSLTEERIAELNDQLLRLRPGDAVTAAYYDDDTKKYCRLTGEVTQVSAREAFLCIGQTQILFSQLYSLCAG